MMQYPYVFILLLALVLCSCSSNKSEIEIRKNLSEISVKRFSENKVAYDKENSRLANILRRINLHYYGNSEKIRLVVLKSEDDAFLSLPDNRILITTTFINNYISKFSQQDLFTILCHESSHIFNNHWGNTINKDAPYANLEKEAGTNLNFPVWIERALNKSSIGNWYFDATLELSTSEDPPFLTNNNSMTSPNSKTTRLSLVSEINNLDFLTEEEFEADIDSISCLKELNIDHKVSSTIYKSLSILRNIDKEMMLKRLHNIQSYEKEY